MPPISLGSGTLRVNFTYLGQPLSSTGARYQIYGLLEPLGGQSSRYLYVSSGDVGGIGDLEPGDYNFHPIYYKPSVGPVFPVTIVAGQTTEIDVDFSATHGLVTGTILVNGQPGGSVSLGVRDENGLYLGGVQAYSTQSAGVFTGLLPAGNGYGSANPGGIPISPFTVLAGQTTNLGGVLGNTQAGSDVFVQPDAIDQNGVPITPGPVSFVFDEVTIPGDTTVTVTQPKVNDPPPPLGFKFPKPNDTLFALETDAQFTGSVHVCISYASFTVKNLQKLALFHYDESMVPASWMDITDRDPITGDPVLDTVNGFICGTTPSFSLFAIFEPANEPPIADAGQDFKQECNSIAGTQVTLDGSASYDPDNDPLTFTWTGPFPEGGGTVTGPTPTVTLSPGTSTITLVVNDGQENSEPDTVDVAVAYRVEGLKPPSCRAGH